MMIQSMTGYGKSIIQLSSKKITVELRSLNSKNADINVRIPSIYREKELELRNRIVGTLIRGKIDFNIYVDMTGQETLTKINKNIVEQYIDQLKTITDGDETELLKIAIRMPDVLKTERDEIDEDEYKLILQALENALEDIVIYRIQEGKVLEEDFMLRINSIATKLEHVEQIDAIRIQKIRERLEKAVAEIKENVDENRFEQELIYYLEKYDITEEKVRLGNHIDYFKTAIQAVGSKGKKMGFICQEIGREINTMGSKANDASLQRVVVEMKDELEKIKEQLLNVL